ncbi:MAG: phosphoglyceromutase, partial [Steroidobacterales bacterium]
MHQHILRAACCALILALCAPAPRAHAETPAAGKTRNVVLIVSDGLRWQEMFTGADPTLLNEKNGGIWYKEPDLRRDFWRDDPKERRRALFP